MTTRFRDWFDWLGTTRRENEDITSDALRIGQLEAALKTARDEAARAIVNAAIWERTWERAEDQLREAQPLIEYALRQKANRAKYDAKRRGRA